jgi:2-oxoglutarate ferredoxin oxidoreductase subunit beta
VYGLTKGQFSATADKGSKSKKGAGNQDEPIDLVSLAIVMGATFVARSFSGDKKQLVDLVKAAIEHKGAAFIDCISPCVAFNNHPGSTKSFDYVREHNEAVNAVEFIEGKAEIKADYAPGTATLVRQHDGTYLKLRKLAADYDPTDKSATLAYLMHSHGKGEVVTGLLYVEPESQDLCERIELTATPLNRLGDTELCPGSTVLEKINAELR